MCYGVDIDTEVLLKCAIDHHLVMYYDEGCSEPESDEDGGFGTAPFGDADIGGMGLSGQNDSGETGWRGIVVMQVQLFYAWQLYKLTRNKLVAAAIVLTSLVGGLAGIGTAIGVDVFREFAKLLRLKVLVSLWLNGFSRTDTVISRVTQLIVSNGLLTAIFAVAGIIAFRATILRNKSYHLIFDFPLWSLLVAVQLLR
ncbi:hypothetical protein FOMPIDRAFT_1054697 [Fomitopsis schrenkii]|uniref:Uncharacterized protein n=1 Tax=Fomitopsis schrenkii TaxID=2126942 RepID=S8DQA4_FOMSC|nr:hypothetical protein FOMPIDRAFT_1054697 [Fomitopsis schrenkii]